MKEIFLKSKAYPHITLRGLLQSKHKNNLIVFGILKDELEFHAIDLKDDYEWFEVTKHKRGNLVEEIALGIEKLRSKERQAYIRWKEIETEFKFLEESFDSIRMGEK